MALDAQRWGVIVPVKWGISPHGDLGDWVVVEQFSDGTGWHWVVPTRKVAEALLLERQEIWRKTIERWNGTLPANTA